MFKIKTKNLEFQKIIETKYLIFSHENYKYVITDDPNFCEKDKINIVVNITAIDEIGQLFSKIIAGNDIIFSLESDEGIKKVNVNDIDYFETIESDSYAKVGKKRYYISKTLHNLEEMLKDHHFVRTSKSYLVNILKINVIRPMINNKLLLIMSNGDRIDVNRTYVKSFKEKLDL